MALILSSSEGTNGTDDGRGRGEGAMDALFDGTGDILGSEYIDGDVKGVVVTGPFDRTEDVDETLDANETLGVDVRGGIGDDTEARGDIIFDQISFGVDSSLRIMLLEDTMFCHDFRNGVE